MAVNTILFDFSVDENITKNEAQLFQIIDNVENILKDFLVNFKQLSGFSYKSGLVRLYTSDPEAVIQLRVYTNGLITLNIDYCRNDNQIPILSYQRCKELEKDILDRLMEAKQIQSLPALKRGDYSKYYITSDERLVEYDIDKILFEETSLFQKVQVVHSKSLGNMLVLDNLQNIAEADTIYTQTLMDQGREKYTDKEIAILGGGDGALLHELLKENPKEVIMMEIDEVVIKACAKHMTSICGDVLDSFTGPNYNIMLGDCLKSLEECHKEGRTFDYIFGDLTDVPIAEKLTEEIWTFINKILQLSFKLLRPDGKFMTHLNGASSPDTVETYKSLLKNIQPPVTFTISKAFVPSFMEEWIFCKVRFDPNKFD